MDLTSDLIAVDVETTGPNPFVHDLLSLALVPIVGESEPLLVYVRPEQLKWSPFAFQNFQRFDHDWQTFAVSPPEALFKIENYLSRLLKGQPATLVGHNVGFDMGFLRKLAFLCGKTEIQGVSHRTLDTHTLLYLAWLQGKLPHTALTSDGAFQSLGIGPPAETRHTAQGDALATKTLFLRLVALLSAYPMSSMKNVAR
jgi:DNA polymerase-3 subunit epsilon